MVEVESTHPFAGKIVKLKVVFDEGKGPKNQYVGTRNDDKAIRCNYANANDNETSEFELFAVEGRPDIYTMFRHHNNADLAKWVSWCNESLWLYARYGSQGDAMKFLLKKHDKNASHSYIGECYTMKNVYHPC